MATFKVRVTQPKETDWVEVEGEDLVAAIQQYHFDQIGFNYRHIPTVTLWVEGKERQHFTEFETEDGQKLISRICQTGIWRKGGVHAPGRPRSLADVERIFGVEEGHLQGEWIGEEEYQR